MLVFYIARWIAPLFGVLLLAGVRFDTVHGLSAAGSLLIAVGIFDATLVAALTSVGGVELETGPVAALVTYRVVTIGTTAVLGALFIASWRHTRRQTDPHPAQP